MSPQNIMKIVKHNHYTDNTSSHLVDAHDLDKLKEKENNKTFFVFLDTDLIEKKKEEENRKFLWKLFII